MIDTAGNEIHKDNSQLKADFQKEAIPHMNAVYNFALRMTGDEDDADDLVKAECAS